MKNIILLFLFFIASLNFAKAQTDPCADIKKTRDDAKKLTSYASPVLQHIRLNKRLVDNEPVYGISFYIMFSFNIKDADYDAKGVWVTFADGTIWKVPDPAINCSYLNVDDGYNLHATGELEGKDPEQFKAKKVVKIRIGDHEMDIDDAYAIKFMAYVKCIDDIKK